MERVLSECLVILLKRIPAKALLNNEIQSINLNTDDLHDIFLPYMSNYSDTELRNILNSLQSALKDYVEFDSTMRHAGDKLNLFNAIFNFSDSVLVEQDNDILCRYTSMLRWRRITSQISEETFVMAFKAKRDTMKGTKGRYFAYKPIISHNNMQLKAMMNEGMSENHFHLMGSAPYFQLSWIQLMNNLSGNKVLEQLRRLEYNRRNVNISYSRRYQEESFVDKARQAYLIRLYLFSRLSGIRFKFCSYKVTYDEIKYIISPKYKEDDSIDLNYETELEKCRVYISEKDYDFLWEKKSLEYVSYLLCNPDRLAIVMSEIQQLLHALKGSRKLQQKDYAFLLTEYEMHEKQGSYVELWGERIFLYLCFKEICQKGYLFSVYETNLFHAYLLIKESLRGEMVQENSYVGFENFQIHQDRKEYFSTGIEFEKKMARMAVRDTLQGQNIISLEARLSPYDTAKGNYQKIHFLDEAIDKEHMLRDRYFYVFHFIKGKEQKREIESDVICRSFYKRNDVHKRTRAIINFRERYPESAMRVLGIDAAAQEIGCRPEVFGVCFRYLKAHTWTYGIMEEKKILPQLRISYHVGEDFLDIVDGLRAIDEAIHFLNMDCGDRLGHALALGTEPDEWYASKRYHISMPVQEYLDNVVWVYYAMIKYHIDDTDNIKSYLESEFTRCFRKIYGEIVNTADLEYVAENVRNRMIKNEKYSAYELYGGSTTAFSFDIHTYYNAWQIRGDEPVLYRKGYFEGKRKADFRMNEYRTNAYFPKDFSIRYVPEIAYLYHLYHYSSNVKKAGKIQEDYYVTPALIRVVKAIQRELKKEIAARGIGIETNPSSNYMIGAFKRYSKHPIVNFYNQGLVVDQKLLEECPQIWCSINTDDQGVFGTSLENEYALMACALEREKGQDGKPIYNKNMIYQWLDNIRINGNRQSFNVALIKADEDDKKGETMI